MSNNELAWFFGLPVANAILSFLVAASFRVETGLFRLSVAVMVSLAADVLLAFCLVAGELYISVSTGIATIVQVIPSLFALTLYFSIVFSCLGVSGGFVGALFGCLFFRGGASDS
jgi:hypothetical protein